MYTTRCRVNWCLASSLWSYMYISASLPPQAPMQPQKIPLIMPIRWANKVRNMNKFKSLAIDEVISNRQYSYLYTVVARPLWYLLQAKTIIFIVRWIRWSHGCALFVQLPKVFNIPGRILADAIRQSKSDKSDKADTPNFPVSDLDKMTVTDFTQAFTYSYFEIPVQCIIDAIQCRLRSKNVGKVWVTDTRNRWYVVCGIGLGVLLKWQVHVLFVQNQKCIMFVYIWQLSPKSRRERDELERLLPRLLGLFKLDRLFTLTAAVQRTIDPKPRVDCIDTILEMTKIKRWTRFPTLQQRMKEFKDLFITEKPAVRRLTCDLSRSLASPNSLSRSRKTSKMPLVPTQGSDRRIDTAKRSS